MLYPSSGYLRAEIFLFLFNVSCALRGNLLTSMQTFMVIICPRRSISLDPIQTTHNTPMTGAKLTIGHLTGLFFSHTFYRCNGSMFSSRVTHDMFELRDAAGPVK